MLREYLLNFEDSRKTGKLCCLGKLENFGVSRKLRKISLTSVLPEKQNCALASLLCKNEKYFATTLAIKSIQQNYTPQQAQTERFYYLFLYLNFCPDFGEIKK